MKSIALYPGSFDPFTYGHLDILERATHMFDTVIVTVADNTRKEYVFTVNERIDLINRCIEGQEWSKQVQIEYFRGLLVEFARRKHAQTLVRGVRQISDFEYEFRMALMNRRLSPDVDTVFLMPSEELTFVSASLVREIAYWQGDLTQFVPKVVADALRSKYANNNSGD